MVKKWESFEKHCCEYLHSNLSDILLVVPKGSADSSVSDIQVIDKKGSAVFIEVKSSEAQCGQFVVFADTENEKFYYSPNNKSPENQYTKQICQHMTDNYKIYQSAGTSGKRILFKDCEKIFTDWIIDYYKSKNTWFVITENNIIFPIEKFSDYFSITASYRTKRSGSSKLPKKDISIIMDYLEQNKIATKYEIISGGVFISTNKNYNKYTFNVCGKEYILSEKPNCMYEIRKLSNTANRNVIFSISLKDNVQGMSIANFRSAIIKILNN